MNRPRTPSDEIFIATETYYMGYLSCESVSPIVQVRPTRLPRLVFSLEQARTLRHQCSTGLSQPARLGERPEATEAAIWEVHVRIDHRRQPSVVFHKVPTVSHQKDSLPGHT